ncbi:MAG: replication-associated recombination protein A [Planctomycetes bacterium]|nr:replication-associated recombination protein A [Planctomycetota bacterium]
MRPRTLDEVVGQEALLGPEGTLRGAYAADPPPSLVLWGPPGTGKTTLARLLAATCGTEFVALSAVAAGVKEVRAVLDTARRLRARGRRTILFLDEIHRFNKAQQDLLLPSVESALITLIGATTENPSFEVNAALLSRCRVVVLAPLSVDHLAGIVARAASDPVRGLLPPLPLDKEAAGFIANFAGGDARAALNLLEMAHQRARREKAGAISPDLVRRVAGAKALRYDPAGEEHYNVISAFIKSMRGSDPHAALYWLGRMVAAGEDPLFIARRMVIFASEDVGMADSRALPLAVAAFQAAHQVGWPEAHFPLAHAAAYLATAPKSNAVTRAMRAVAETVEATGPLAVPLHLRNAPTALMKNLGYGAEYRYPHDFPDAFTGDDYLPDEIADRAFYAPTDRGEEADARARMASRARLAARRDAKPPSRAPDKEGT